MVICDGEYAKRSLARVVGCKASQKPEVSGQCESHSKVDQPFPASPTTLPWTHRIAQAWQPHSSGHTSVLIDLLSWFWPCVVWGLSGYNNSIICIYCTLDNQKLAKQVPLESSSPQGKYMEQPKERCRLGCGQDRHHLKI